MSMTSLSATFPFGGGSTMRACARFARVGVTGVPTQTGNGDDLHRHPDIDLLGHVRRRKLHLQELEPDAVLKLRVPRIDPKHLGPGDDAARIASQLHAMPRGVLGTER